MASETSRALVKPDRDGVRRGERPRCTATAKSGGQCGSFARKGSDPPRCGMHDEARREQPLVVGPLEKALRRGDPRSMMTAMALVGLDVSQRRMSARDANAIRGAVKVWLEAYGVHELEAEVRRLRERLERSGPSAARGPRPASDDDFRIEG